MAEFNWRVGSDIDFSVHRHVEEVLAPALSSNTLNAAGGKWMHDEPASSQSRSLYHIQRHLPGAGAWQNAFPPDNTAGIDSHTQDGPFFS